MTFRGLLRRRNDSGAIWGDIAREDHLDTETYLRRGLSRFVFLFCVAVGVAAFAWQQSLIADLQRSQPNVTQVIQAARDSIVSVECGSKMGTGFVISVPVPDNYKSAILSADHIFEECNEGDKVSVSIGGVDYRATLAKKDPQTGKVPTDGTPSNDMALLYVDADLPALSAAPEAKVGDWAIVIGNPWSYTNYVTFGIISNVDHDSYSADIAVNAGNSGGPILDSHGRVLGVVTSVPIDSDLIDGNPKGIWAQAHGIATTLRLRQSCARLFASEANCPFEN